MSAKSIRVGTYICCLWPVWWSPPSVRLAEVCGLLRHTELHSSLSLLLVGQGCTEGVFPLCKPLEPQLRNAGLVERPISDSKDQTETISSRKLFEPRGRAAYVPLYPRAVPSYPRLSFTWESMTNISAPVPRKIIS